VFLIAVAVLSSLAIIITGFFRISFPVGVVGFFAWCIFGFHVLDRR